MTTILLVDDHQMFLAGSRMILEKHGFDVTTASSAAEAIERIDAKPYDMYLFDLNLPESSGYELVRHTTERHPGAIVIILTGELLSEHFDRLMDARVSGMLEKASTEHDLIVGIQLAQQGRMALPLPLVRQLRTKGRLAQEEQQPEAARSRRLTDNEVSVLRLARQGCKNKDIAAALFMSQRNVEYLLSNVFEKLQVSSRQEAAAKAAELGYL